MTELLAPALLALLFILFGLSHRGRPAGGCAACTGAGECEGKASGSCSSRAAACSDSTELDRGA